MRKITSGKKSKGQATLEMLLVLIVLVPLFFGGIELARAVSIRHSLDSGVFVATRAISLNPTDTAYAQTLVQDALTNNIFSEQSLGMRLRALAARCWGADSISQPRLTIPPGSLLSVVKKLPSQFAIMELLRSFTNRLEASILNEKGNQSTKRRKGSGSPAGHPHHHGFCHAADRDDRCLSASGDAILGLPDFTTRCGRWRNHWNSGQQFRQAYFFK